MFFTNKNVSYVVGFLTLKSAVKSLKIALRNFVRVVQLCTILEFPDILKRAPKADYDMASFDSEIQSWVTDKGRYDVKFAASAERYTLYGAVYG